MADELESEAALIHDLVKETASCLNPEVHCGHLVLNVSLVGKSIKLQRTLGNGFASLADKFMDLRNDLL